MMRWCPIVSCLKRARSGLSRQGSWLSTPMTPFSAAATIIDRLIESSYGDGRLDRRVRVVIVEREVFVLELVDRLHRRVEAHRRQRARLARELRFGLLEMI